MSRVSDEALAEDVAKFVSRTAWQRAPEADRVEIVSYIVGVLEAFLVAGREACAEGYERAMEAEGISKYQRERIHDAVTQCERRERR